MLADARGEGEHVQPAEHGGSEEVKNGSFAGAGGRKRLQSSSAGRRPAINAWEAVRYMAPGAVALASLHSGSIHHYSRRMTLRWEAIPPERLAETVRAIDGRGVTARRLGVPRAGRDDP